MRARGERNPEPGWQQRWGRRGPGSMRAKTWSTEEIHSLRELLQQNYSWPAVAAALNRSCSSVQRRARQHGLTRRGTD
jgi:hypothetical protein